MAADGGLITASTGTLGYRVEFHVLDKKHAGRRLWKTWYLSEAAKPYSKRDLTKFGLDTAAKLNGPFPRERFVCRLAVVVRTDDDGVERNEVREVQVLREQRPEADPFAPTEAGGAE